MAAWLPLAFSSSPSFLSTVAPWAEIPASAAMSPWVMPHPEKQALSLAVKFFIAIGCSEEESSDMLQALKGVRHLHSTVMKQTELSIPVPWGHIRGKVWGPDHGRPVLCLHGWADNCGTFNTLIPLLPKECRYVAVDMSGHGLSSHRPPGVSYSFPAYVMDVRRVIDGGNIAGMFSALYPEMVDAVVLLDSYGFLPTDVKEICSVMRQGMDQMCQFEKQTEEKKRRVYTYEKAVERMLVANPSLPERSVHILLERGLVQVEGGMAFTRDFRINLKNIVRITLEQSQELQSRIKNPLLIVLAKDRLQELYTGLDKQSSAAFIQSYKDRNHTVVMVPGNHHVHLNQPEVVAPLLRTFSLIGHSMGADIAAVFTALYPEMVDALVLLDSYGFLPTDSKELPEVVRQGMEEALQLEQKSKEEKRVYTHEKAVERLSAANPTLTEQSVHVLLERGLVQVEGGFKFSRDLRIHSKNTWRMSLEQSLEMQSRHTVVTVPGGHHVHLDQPEVVAPIVSDFLRNRAPSQSNDVQHKL
ncbi:Serine hydrolase-like protein [Liparis tanakae]|uniref:Serine hydrolase-like protein n=1 Tax=Liparis tanakae TaxID=230148 RepID=A0A4Z2J0V6_9TELE|nr:Serine hydrolase-like protein [Liparis tanakae]